MTKQYKALYVDPPWSYRDKATAGNRGAACKYPTQTEEWLKTLPVQRVMADNCVLFMWVTMPKLDVCWDIITAWGFDYKTVAFTWIKVNKRTPSLFMGMGNWTRANSELCLLATKGKPKRVDAGVHSVVISPIETHSKKPDIVRDRIVQLMGDIPRLELFARQVTPGWDAMGFDIDGQDIKTTLEQL